MSPDTLPIDVIVAGIRIHRASGTHSASIRDKMKRRMLPDLKSSGRLDILRALRDGEVSFLVVFDAWTRKQLQELPIGAAMPIVAEAMAAWIEKVRTEYSPEHIEGFETSLAVFKNHDAAARIADLPRVLEELRDTKWAEQHPRSFNLARAHAQRFVRAKLKKSHALYIAVAAVEARKVPKPPARVRLTPEAMRGWFPNPDRTGREADIPHGLSRHERMAHLARLRDAHVDAIAWAMVTTGMGQKELWGTWSIESDRIHIVGTKRGGRVRDVPLVRAPAVPAISRDNFEKSFRARMETARVTPYDLRRAYIQWLESAGIPRTRRLMYGGHGTKDVHDLYERHEISAFLVEDAAKLRAFLNLPEPPTTGAIELVK